MVELWISIAVVVVAVIAVLYYLTRNTKLDKVYRKQQKAKQESAKKKDDTKEKTEKINQRAIKNKKKLK